MKCIALLLLLVACASSQYTFYSGISPYTSHVGYPYSARYVNSYNPFLLRKKRSAEEPAQDQEGQNALVYSSLAGYSGYSPYSAYSLGAYPYSYAGVPYYLRKKRSAEEPAQDQEGQNALVYSSLAGYSGYSPYSAYSLGAYPYSYAGVPYYLRKKRSAEEPAQDQEGQNALYYRSYASAGVPLTYSSYGAYPFTYSAYPFLKK